jgi:ferredoxin
VADFLANRDNMTTFRGEVSTPVTHRSVCADNLSGRACAGTTNLDPTLYDRTMRVEVNADLCQGHNRCYALAPELFDVDDYGTAIVLGDGTVTPELEDKARLAVANCPEYAITIVE